MPKGTNIHMQVYPTPVVPKQYIVNSGTCIHIYIYEDIAHTGSPNAI